jgi:hypothetical protein
MRGSAVRIARIVVFGRGFRGFGALRVGVLGLVGFAGVAHAQPDAAESMRAHNLVRGWVDAWRVDEGAETPVDLGCAAVTLRLDGRVIGRGRALARDGDPLVLAARGAIARARATVRAGRDTEPTDESWASLADRLTVSLELGGRAVPISDAELAGPYLGMSVGRDALVVRLGDRGIVMTPDEFVSSRIDPARAAYALATELGNDGGLALASVAELLERGFSFARCETVWLAQPGAGKGAVFLDRGGRIIEQGEAGLMGVRAMGEGLVSYLGAQRWAGVEPFGIVGTRDVVTGRCEPEIAPVYEQALAALALSRWASVRGDARAVGIAREILSDLARVEPGEALPWADVAGAAACVVAVDEFRALGEATSGPMDQLWARCVERVERAHDPDTGFAGDVVGAMRGLVAWALVRAGDEGREDAVRRVYREMERGMLVGQMPFLGFAELELSGHAETVGAREALRAMRERVWEHQVVRADLGDPGDRDLLGAIVFTSKRDAMPTSDVMRPLSFLCAMLGDPRLSGRTMGEDGLATDIARTGDAMRFARQLVMDPVSSFLSAAPDKCAGGVRVSLTDWRVSPAMSSMALLACAEFERSVVAIAGREETPGQ